MVTKSEKFRTEVKELSRVLLVLSVAVITVITSVNNPTENVNGISGLKKIVIGGQLLSIFCGVLLQAALIKFTREEYALERGVIKYSSLDKLVDRMFWYDKAQILFFLASLALLACTVFAWVDPPIKRSSILGPFSCVFKGIT